MKLVLYIIIFQLSGHVWSALETVALEEIKAKAQ